MKNTQFLQFLIQKTEDMMKQEFDLLVAAVKRLEADDQAKSATITSQQTEIDSLTSQLAAAVAAGSDLPVTAITDLTAEVNAIVPPPA